MKLIQSIPASRSDVNDGQRGRSQHFVDQLVALIAMRMIEIDRQNRAELLVANHKIKVLPLDVIG